MLVMLPKSQQQCVRKLHHFFLAGHNGLWEEKAQGTWAVLYLPQTLS